MMVFPFYQRGGPIVQIVIHGYVIVVRKSRHIEKFVRRVK